MKKPSGSTENSDAKLALKKTAAKGKAAKDPKKPKSPASAYSIFMEDFRKQFQEENPDVKSDAQIGKAGGAKWDAMSDSDKAPYLEQVAYTSVVKALKARSDDAHLSTQKGLLTALRKELHISDEMHIELLHKGNTDMPLSLRKWNTSKSRLSGCSSNLIRRKLRTLWKEDGNFYDAVIVDQGPSRGDVNLAYFKGTTQERREWVNLNWFSPGDIEWVPEDP